MGGKLWNIRAWGGGSNDEMDDNYLGDLLRVLHQMSEAYPDEFINLRKYIVYAFTAYNAGFEFSCHVNPAGRKLKTHWMSDLMLFTPGGMSVLTNSTVDDEKLLDTHINSIKELNAAIFAHESVVRALFDLISRNIHCNIFIEQDFTYYERSKKLPVILGIPSDVMEKMFLVAHDKYKNKKYFNDTCMELPDGPGFLEGEFNYRETWSDTVAYPLLSKKRDEEWEQLRSLKKKS